MKKLILLVCQFVVYLGVLAQTTPTIPVTSEIEEVFLYLQGAQIVRTAQIDLDAGKQLLEFENLSPFLDPKSIQVSFDGPATLLTINHLIDFLAGEADDSPLKTYKDNLETIGDSIQYKEALLTVLSEELTFLNSNRNVNGNTENLDLDRLQSIYAFYAKRLKTIKIEELAIRKELLSLREEKGKIEKQIKELFKDVDNRKSKIEILVETDEPLQVEIQLSYFCKGAGWFPAYDVVATAIDAPIALTYKARVYQRTGEDWDQVSLTLSNSNPNLNSSLPVLSPLYLNYGSSAAYRSQKRQNNSGNVQFEPSGIGLGEVSGHIVDENGEALIGATISIPGTSAGAVTDIDGTFSVNIPAGTEKILVSYIGFDDQEVYLNGQVGEVKVALRADEVLLEEVVVTGYGGSNIKSENAPTFVEKERSIPVQKVENPTTVNFKIDLPFSIPSNGETFLVELAQYELPAYYEYRTIPKVENTPFLTAKIKDWEDYNLLEGDANIFFEDTYLGRSLMDVRFIEDSLDISLGRDKGILVNRSKIRDYYKETFVNNKKVETRAFEILVQNNKDQSVNIIVVDQVPISRRKDIEVQKIDLGGGTLNKDTGELTWKLNLPPGMQKKLQLNYTVKYDRYRNVKIE